MLKSSIVAFLIAFISTYFMRKLAIRINAVDIPKDERRVHKKPIPYLGGVAIYLGLCLSLLFTARELLNNRAVVSIIIGGSIIMISGLIDDLKGLSPKGKIVFQLLAGLIVFYSGLRIEFLTNPFSFGGSTINFGIFSLPVTLFWLVGITNTVNLIDGLDGLAAGIATIASIAFTIVALKLGRPDMASLSIMLASSCLGFLPYNFNPASIFMGDCGSLFLGFILAAISIEGVIKSVATISIVIPVLILSIPIFDTAFAILRRFLNKQPIARADKGHLHHRLLEKGFSQRATVGILYLISGIFAFFSVIIAEVNSKKSFYLALGLLILGVGLAGKIGIFERRD